MMRGEDKNEMGGFWRERGFDVLEEVLGVEFMES